MNYLSVCSGVEAATVAWHQMGWNPVAFSEIEKFPSQVLRHHYPQVLNLGDMTKFKEWKFDRAINLLVGGTPCQSFSVAGLRKGLEDPRGNLALTYVAILDKFRPKWCVWENVPGVLSSNGGRDFGSFLGALVELGYGFSYRVLDAQNFGIAQRRRRVFVVGHLGDWRPSAEVLFEPQSLSGNTKKIASKGKDLSRCLARGVGTRLDGATDANAVAQPILLEDQGGSVINTSQNGIVGTLRRETHGHEPCVIQSMAVRRLTPVECERLQGFPDNYTDIQFNGKPTPDGSRYKAMGNSMAVPVMRWIGKRIDLVNGGL